MSRLTISRGWMTTIGGAAVVVALLAWAMRPAPVQVETDTVTRGSMRAAIQEDGKTRIRERFIISAPLTGRLMRIELDPGDSVEPSATLLAAIEPQHPDLLDPRALAEAQARVRGAEAAVARSGPQVKQAETELELAQRDLEQIQAAAARNAASSKELDDARLLAQIRGEEVRAARFAQQIAEFELQTAQAALILTRADDTTSQNANPFQLRSPCRGRVLRVFQESAAFVTAGTPLLEIGDPGNLELVIDVLSTDAVKISSGDPVVVEHWGGPDELRGRVRLVEPAAYTKVSALGVEEQRVDVIVDLVDPRDKWRTLGDAYRVEAAIIVWSGTDVRRVHAGALFRNGDGWAVFVVNSGRAELRTIDIGHRTDTHAEVLDGLEEGDAVILHPGDRVDDGSAVQVTSTER